MAGLTLVAAPASEPVTLAEAKLFAKVTGSADDTLVTDLLTGARKLCEEWFGWALITQTWDLFLDEFPDPIVTSSPRDGFTPLSGTWAGQNYLLSAPIKVPFAPLQSITFIKYTDYQGNLVTVSSSDYLADATLNMVGLPQKGRIVPVVGKTWPIVMLQALNGVNVRFVSGFGAAASNVPEHIRTVIKQIVAIWYYNRDLIGTMPEAVGNAMAGTVGGFALA